MFAAGGQLIVPAYLDIRHLSADACVPAAGHECHIGVLPPCSKAHQDMLWQVQFNSHISGVLLPLLSSFAANLRNCPVGVLQVQLMGA